MCLFISLFLKSVFKFRLELFIIIIIIIIIIKEDRSGGQVFFLPFSYYY